MRRALIPRSIVTVKRILAVLGDHAEEVPSLVALAGMGAMSPSHFSRTFHAVAGMPLRAYVRKLRVKHASELLASSRRSVTFIALECGFYDLPHLDKAFRRQLGMTPHEFRRRHVARLTRAGG